MEKEPTDFTQEDPRANVSSKLATDKKLDRWILGSTIALTWLFIAAFSIFLMCTIRDAMKVYDTALDIVSAEDKAAPITTQKPKSSTTPKANGQVKIEKYDLIKEVIGGMLFATLWIAIVAAIVTTGLIAILKYSFNHDDDSNNQLTIEPPFVRALVDMMNAASDFIRNKKG